MQSFKFEFIFIASNCLQMTSLFEKTSMTLFTSAIGLLITEYRAKNEEKKFHFEENST